MPERVASSAADAVAAALEVALPVKTAAPGAHKTETGGIALDLTSEEAAYPRSSGSDVPSSCSP